MYHSTLIFHQADQASALRTDTDLGSGIRILSDMRLWDGNKLILRLCNFSALAPRQSKNNQLTLDDPKGGYPISTVLGSPSTMSPIKTTLRSEVNINHHTP